MTLTLPRIVSVCIIAELMVLLVSQGLRVPDLGHVVWLLWVLILLPET